MADHVSYKTVEGEALAEIVEKKSRFIGHVRHVETEEEALAFINEVKAQHRTARHNVYAYVLRNGRVRYTDDGEPSGTAGMPVLETLQHAGLQDVGCVVTRYFGGVLLGTGGLVRAYTQAVQAALDTAYIVTISRCVDVTLTVPYSLYEQVGRLASAQGAHSVSVDFTDVVSLVFRMEDGTQDAFVNALTELLRGDESVQVSEPYHAPMSVAGQEQAAV